MMIVRQPVDELAQDDVDDDVVLSCPIIFPRLSTMMIVRQPVDELAQDDVDDDVVLSYYLP